MAMEIFSRAFEQFLCRWWAKFCSSSCIISRKKRGWLRPCSLLAWWSWSGVLGELGTSEGSCSTIVLVNWGWKALTIASRTAFCSSLRFGNATWSSSRVSPTCSAFVASVVLESIVKAFQLVLKAGDRIVIGHSFPASALWALIVRKILYFGQSKAEQKYFFFPEVENIG